MGVFRRLALVLTLVVAALVALPGLALADESIAPYDVTIAVAANGSFHVREQLSYDFGSADRHGILRTIPVRYRYDSTYDRVVEVTNIVATSPSGAPTDVATSVDSGVLTIKVGDPGRTVSGRQSYVLDYDVGGAMNAFPDHAEVYWNAIGPEWAASISSVKVTVRGPAAPTKVACYAGPDGSGLPCTSARIVGGQAVFTQGALDPYQGLTVAVGLPAGSVTVPPPLLAEQFSVSRAFAANRGTISGAIAVLLAALAGIGYVAWARGRDRRWRGQVPGLEPTAPTPMDDSSTERQPLFGRTEAAVEFAPPADVRPGEIGTLLDERVNPLDVTATIVDLAVRGYLHIEELPRDHFFTSRDWLLTQQKPPDDALRAYETILLDGLFAARTTVRVSELKRTFSATLAKIEQSLYLRVVEVGWFAARPDRTRARWVGLGALCVALGAGLTYLLATRTHAGLIGLAAVLAGLVLMWVARKMPARTAKGSAVLARVQGFRQYIRTAEAEQLRFEERADVFSRYLPYAIVFGETDRWAKAFASLGTVGSNGSSTPLGWYTGPVGWNFGHFGSSMRSFSDTTGGAVAATAASSGGSGFSGGSSGGGFGGGGGGSW